MNGVQFRAGFYFLAFFLGLARTGLCANPAHPGKTVAGEWGLTSEIKLPAPTDMVIGANFGKYLLCRLPSLKKLAVISVADSNLIRLIDLPDRNTPFACGGDRLYLADTKNDIITCMNIDTLKKQWTIINPELGPVFAMAAGSFSKHSGLVIRTLESAARSTMTGVLDPDSSLYNRLSGGVDSDTKGMAVAALDGRTIGYWIIHSGYGVAIYNPVKSQWEKPPRDQATHNLNVTAGEIRPDFADAIVNNEDVNTAYVQSDDSRYVVCVRDGDPTEAFKPGRQVPHARIFIFDPTLRLSVNLKAPPEVFREKRLDENSTRASVLHYFAFAKKLISLSKTDDVLIVHAFDISPAMKRLGVPYLIAPSVIPVDAERGKQFSWNVEVQCSSPIVHFAVEGGPEGMTVSPAGKVVWNVPWDFKEDIVTAVVVARDDSGQELPLELLLHISAGDR